MAGVLCWDRGVGREEVFVGEDIEVGEVIEGAAVNGEGDLDFGFVGRAIDASYAAIRHFQRMVCGKARGKWTAWSRISPQ